MSNESKGELCSNCNGSGEGYVDGSRCTTCKGRGVIYFKEEEDLTPWCHACGSMTSKNCNCGPIADNA